MIIAGDANVDFRHEARLDPVARLARQVIEDLGLILATGTGYNSTHDAGAVLDVVAAEPWAGQLHAGGPRAGSRRAAEVKVIAGHTRHLGAKRAV